MSLDIDRVMNLLSRSGIVNDGQLRQLRQRVAADVTLKTVETFTRELVRLGHLTEFQAQEVCRGKAEQLILGDYLLIDEIGQGGMGQVYRARHSMMNREVAIKLMRPDTLNSVEHIQRFRREVEAAAQLTHPNIVNAFDAGEFDGHYFLVMEYVRGQDLRRRIRQSGPLSISLALNYLLQAAQGLEYAHKRGVIHRDVKPSNLLLSDDGTVKVLDLGLSLVTREAGPAFEASVPQTDLTETGQVMGTVDFMSPEQALHAHEVDPRCDIYSLGCTLHYLLTGMPPYLGDSMMSRLVAHRENPIPQLSRAVVDAPPRLDDVFRSLMAKKPEDRFQTMSDVIANLQLCRMDLSGNQDIPETIRFTPTRTPTHRRAKKWLVLGGVLVTAAVLATAWLRPWETSTSATSETKLTPADATLTEADAKPAPPEKTEPERPKRDVSQPFNPLDQLDLDANVVSGSGWSREGERLTTAVGPATLQLPGELPTEYEFRFVATRQKASGPLIIGLRVGDHQCYVLLDAGRNNGERVTALGTDSNGKMVNPRKGIALELETPTPVICRVTATGIDLIVGTESAIDWRGRPSDLKLGGGWRVPDKQALFLGTNDGAVFELSELRVSPLRAAP